MRGFSRNILDHIRDALKKPEGKLQILEVGPGKGYFYSACRADGNIDYFAVDRNERILSNLADLPNDHKTLGDAPELPNDGRTFDVIYASFVIEHLIGGGEAQYRFINEAKKRLRPGGLIVLQAPDCEKLGAEFWNIDYTHTFPTTKRSIAHAFYDNEIDDVTIYDISGLLTHRFFTNRYVYLLTRVLLFPYQYKICNWFAHYLFGLKSYSYGNLFFSAYGLLKEENLLIVARMPSA